ncbi:MAG TPA: branched-chain amino acid ABC transporter permease [Pseudonocardiaceae bacterium]|nr:branched-chain amino acid ABC transporter permease [Pseudonocardiaceae bacterium]
MNALVLLTSTGLGLGALYYLVASGLSLIFGLMDVVNFGHGGFLTVGAYATWWALSGLSGWGIGGFVLAGLIGTAVGAVLAAGVETALIRPLYRRRQEQILVTVGLGLALPALVTGIWGADAHVLPLPKSLTGTVALLGAEVPLNRFVLIGVAALVLVALRVFLARTRYGLIVRAGVEDRDMVTALGIDVRRAFTLVFAIGGALAGLGGALAGLYYGSVDPGQGTSLLIFAFVVVVVGGMRPTGGVVVAAAVIGLAQQFADYYLASGLGDLAVVVVLAVALLRPQWKVA